MIGESAGFGYEILKRWPLDVFVFALAAISGIKVIFKERAEVDLFKGIFLVSRRRCFFGRGQTLTLFFTAANIVDQRNRVFELFQYWILDHFLINHVLQLKLIERKDADHLHEAGREDLPLRDF